MREAGVDNEQDRGASAGARSLAVVERLCYVEGSFAYFTTRELDQQWGDDWNDAPYEHNAGQPYRDWNAERAGMPPQWQITKVAFETELETPADLYGPNSPYSVEQINAREVAWLIDPAYGERPREFRPIIWAGISLVEFITAIHDSGGQVYLPATDTSVAPKTVCDPPTTEPATEED